MRRICEVLATFDVHSLSGPNPFVLIPQSTIDNILQTAVIEDVVSDYVELKKSGSTYRGLSPFTNEKTPSFYVVPAKSIFKCFSSGKGGSVVTFLMELEKVSYPEALRMLAKRYNIEIEEEEMSEERRAEMTERESLAAVVKWADSYFQNELFETESGQAIGLSYFESRGFRRDVLKKFGIGYCPDQWAAMSQAATAAGYLPERLVAVGLSKTKEEDGSLWDFFKGRVMFPIRDVSGRTIGFGGRTLRSDKKVAKYFNSPESALYHKGKVLYGIDLARPEIGKSDRVFLVEGYTDVLAMHQAGVENVVASSGTALTEGQIKLIHRFTKNITVLFDGDAAGIRASLRGIDLLLAAGMNVRVVLFPDGDDPDSYSKKVSPAELRQHVEEASQDFLAFKIQLLSEDIGDDPIRRAGMIHSVVESVAAIPDTIQRGVYLQSSAAALDMAQDVLAREVDKALHKKHLEVQKAEQRRIRRESQTHRPVSPAGNDRPVWPGDAEAPPPREEFGFSAPFDNVNFTEPEHVIHRRILERDLIRLLIRYGDKPVHVRTANEEEEWVEVQFAELAVHHLNASSMVLLDAPCRSVLTLFAVSMQEEGIPAQDQLVHHADAQVAQLAAESLMERHLVSTRWSSSHGIYHTREEDELEKALLGVLHRLLMNEIAYRTEEVLEQIKDLGENPDENKLKILLERKRELDLDKIHKATYFGVAILG